MNYTICPVNNCVPDKLIEICKDCGPIWNVDLLFYFAALGLGLGIILGLFLKKLIKKIKE